MKCHNDFVTNIEDITALCESAIFSLEANTSTSRTSANAMMRSGWVLLCGYFEGFVRDLLEESIEAINDAKVDINLIPHQLFCNFLEDLPIKYQKNGDDCFISFKNAVKNNGEVSLNAKQLSKTGGNPSVEIVEGLFSGLGLISVIDILSIQDYGLDSTFSVESQVESLRTNITALLHNSTVQNSESLAGEILSVINNKWAPKKKRRNVGYVALIQELLKIRNRIAHGEGRDPITPKELNDYKQGIEKLCTGLHKLAVDSLNQLTIRSRPTLITESVGI